MLTMPTTYAYPVARRAAEAAGWILDDPTAEFPWRHHGAAARAQLWYHDIGDGYVASDVWWLVDEDGQVEPLIGGDPSDVLTESAAA